MKWWPFWPILVHFGAPHGRPHDPSPSILYEVIKDVYPTHQELQNATSPTFLAQFVQKILMKHGPFPWAKVGKSYHHLPCRKKSIFLKKRYGKYFIEACSWFTHMPPKKKWREMISDKPKKTCWFHGVEIWREWSTMVGRAKGGDWGGAAMSKVCQKALKLGESHL